MARWVAILLSVWALSSLVTFTAIALQLTGFGGGAALGTGPNLYDLEVMVGNAALPLTGITGVAFVIWFHRAYRNLKAFGHEPRFGTGWAVGGWLIPLLHWVRPYQIAHEIWTESRLPDEARGATSRPPLVLGLWWAAWVLSSLIGGVGGMVSDIAGSDVLPLGVVALLEVATTLAAALLAIAVVQGLTRRQESLFDEAEPTTF